MGLKATVLALVFHAYISAFWLQIPDSFLYTTVPLWLFCETVLSNVYIGFIYYNNSMPSNMIHIIIVGGKTLCVLQPCLDLFLIRQVLIERSLCSNYGIRC